MTIKIPSKIKDDFSCLFEFGIQMAHIANSGIGEERAIKLLDDNFGLKFKKLAVNIPKGLEQDFKELLEFSISEIKNDIFFSKIKDFDQLKVFIENIIGQLQQG